MTDDAERTQVVTVFLRNDAAVLLLRRSDEVGSYTGQWGAVAGHAEGDPDAAAFEEIREEAGIDESAVTLVRRGDSFEVVDEDIDKRWVVHPYLFDCEVRDVTPNDETTAWTWVPPTEILRRETVPELWTSYDRVRPTPEAVATDRNHGSAALSVRALEVLRDEAALAAERGGDWDDLLAVGRDLVDARPAMTVVVTRVDRAMAAASEAATPESLEAAASEGIERALMADAEAAATAADRLPDRVATLSLSGTALAAIERAGPESVLVAESRPGREGIGTAERVAAATDADVTVTTDAAFGERAAELDIEALVVGADGVLADGRIVNKVGTRTAATVAAREGIDCLVVAASDKIQPVTGDDGAALGGDDGAGPDGDDGVDCEERDPAEVYDGEASVAVANPTFDVTPADLVDAVVTEAGALDGDEIRSVAADHARAAEWRQ